MFSELVAPHNLLQRESFAQKLAPASFLREVECELKPATHVYEIFVLFCLLTYNLFTLITGNLDVTWCTCERIHRLGVNSDTDNGRR